MIIYIYTIYTYTCFIDIIWYIYIIYITHFTLYWYYCLIHIFFTVYILQYWYVFQQMYILYKNHLDLLHSQIFGTFCFVPLFRQNEPKSAKQGRKSRRGRSGVKLQNHVRNVCESYFHGNVLKIRDFSAPSERGDSKTMSWLCRHH